MESMKSLRENRYYDRSRIFVSIISRAFNVLIFAYFFIILYVWHNILRAANAVLVIWQNKIVNFYIFRSLACYFGFIKMSISLNNKKIDLILGVFLAMFSG